MLIIVYKSGITLDYKCTDEYKEWYNTIRSENPDMPDLLIDYAIAFHKANPKTYKQGKQTKTQTSAKRFIIVFNSIYNS